MTWVFALQLALPLIFIAWIAVAPPRSLGGVVIQALATSTGLFALGLAGIWLLPPWWAPYAFGGLLLLAMFIGLRRRPFASLLPSAAGGWTVAALFVVLGGAAVNQAAHAWAGRTPPSGEVVDLAIPLTSGTYLIVNGGSEISINAHLMTMDAAVPRFRAWRGQSYGVDFVEIDLFGLRTHGVQPSEPSAYFIYEAEVIAPCAGVVVAALDGLPDMHPPRVDREHMAGNHVLLRCSDADVLLGHFQPGSVRVALGARVRAGDHIALVGNSGNTGEPHLHIHAQRQGPPGAPWSGDPLPIRFDGRFLVRGARVQLP